MDPEGIEDYEYVELFKKRGDGAFGLGLIRPLAESFKNWTRSTDALCPARKRLGYRLNQPSSR